jgi:hypothetical protein
VAGRPKVPKVERLEEREVRLKAKQAKLAAELEALQQQKRQAEAPPPARLTVGNVQAHNRSVWSVPESSRSAYNFCVGTTISISRAEPASCDLNKCELRPCKVLN